jgi:acyl carrier protein
MMDIPARLTSPLVDVASAIREVVEQPYLDVDPQTLLDDLPEWDSMRFITLIAALEARYGITFGLEEVEALVTVADLVDVITAKRDTD